MRKRINQTLCLTSIFALSFAGFVGVVFHWRSGFLLDPILVRPFGLFPIYWYGVVVLISVGIGFWIATAATISIRVSIWRYAISIVVCALLGARLFDVVFLSPITLSQGITTPKDYLENAVLLFDLNWGGLNIWGALLGGVLMLLWFCWRVDAPRIPIFFNAMIGFLVGLSLAQWGHFINQELYGVPWDGVGGIFIQPVHRIEIYADYNRFVPLFLFAAVWYLVGGLWLFFGRCWRQSAADQFDGMMFGLIWFTVGRLALELATPSSLFNWIPASILLAIIFVTIFTRLASR